MWLCHAGPCIVILISFEEVEAESFDSVMLCRGREVTSMLGWHVLLQVTRAMEQGDIMSIADPQMGSFPPKQGLEPLLKLALACCQNESEARPRMVDIVRELEDIWRITMPAVMSKVDSDTFSIDMDHLQDSHGHSTAQPSSSASFQDVSYVLGDRKGGLRGSANPR